MLAIILGTRPEIIKMSPIIRSCERKGVNFFVLHTGQHYSYEMDRVFFEELGLAAPDFNLDVGSKSHAEQTGLIMTGVEKILAEKNRMSCSFREIPIPFLQEPLLHPNVTCAGPGPYQ